MGLKHFFKSAKLDPADATKVSASRWNGDHYFLNSSGAPIGAVGDLAYRGVNGVVTLVNGAAGVLASAGSGSVPEYTMTPELTSLTIGDATLVFSGNALQLGTEIRILGDGDGDEVFGVNNTDPDLRAFATDVAGDDFNRFNFTISGQIRWGLGATDLDTLFYRSAEAELSLHSINGNDAMLGVTSAAGTSRGVHFKTVNESRWKIFADAVAESGANAGSNFGIASFDDDGDFLETPFSIDRASGNVFLSGSIVLGEEVFVAGGNIRQNAPANGVLTLTNLAGNDFTAMKFGGTTSAYPALRRSGTILDAVLADISAYAPFRALSFTFGAGAGSLYGGSDGVFGFAAVASTTPLFQLGGATSSFPALKRSGALLETKLADDSAYASFAALTFKTMTALVALGGGAAPTLGTIGGSGPTTAGQNTWLRMLDSAGAAFWVPAWK